MSQDIDSIKEYFNEVSGEDFDRCDGLYQLLTSLEPSSQPIAFRYACEVFETIEPAGKERIVSKYNSQLQRLKATYGDLVNGAIKGFALDDMSEDDFYTRMWDFICNENVFDTQAKQIFALYYVIIDKRIPYFNIDQSLLYSLSNERFRELRMQTVQEKMRIRFILKTSFSQRTERASVLLREFGINMPAGDGRKGQDEYERMLMRMEYLLEESDGKSSSTLSRLISGVEA